ncbi:herpesviridae ul52/ul70 dna primase [Toxoplasma gondii VAND]|uniref:DNA-directed primase/polymerase protein n=1 Tax=Toxoplasma gondii VAND TaxID=933077 RepID=A0A086Q7I5_TOXGO|nr:herpesviridae ul52/ul70 dna primase [Toxoplasma gondii VAND]
MDNEARAPPATAEVASSPAPIPSSLFYGVGTPQLSSRPRLPEYTESSQGQAHPRRSLPGRKGDSPLTADGFWERVAQALQSRTAKCQPVFPEPDARGSGQCDRPQASPATTDEQELQLEAPGENCSFRGNSDGADGPTACPRQTQTPKASLRTAANGDGNDVQRTVGNSADLVCPKRGGRSGDAATDFPAFPRYPVQVFRKQDAALAVLHGLPQNLRNLFGLFAQEIAEKGVRRYLVASYRDFVGGYLKMVRSQTQNRHLYEVLMEGQPCWLYFDVEFSKALNPEINGEDAVALLKTLLVKFLRERFAFPLRNSDIVDLDSSTQDKLSRHLIVKAVRDREADIGNRSTSHEACALWLVRGEDRRSEGRGREEEEGWDKDDEETEEKTADETGDEDGVETHERSEQAGDARTERRTDVFSANVGVEGRRSRRPQETACRQESQQTGGEMHGKQCRDTDHDTLSLAVRSHHSCDVSTIHRPSLAACGAALSCPPPPCSVFFSPCSSSCSSSSTSSSSSSPCSSSSAFFSSSSSSSPSSSSSSFFSCALPACVSRSSSPSSSSFSSSSSPTSSCSLASPSSSSSSSASALSFLSTSASFSPPFSSSSACSPPSSRVDGDRLSDGSQADREPDVVEDGEKDLPRTHASAAKLGENAKLPQGERGKSLPTKTGSPRGDTPSAIGASTRSSESWASTEEAEADFSSASDDRRSPSPSHTVPNRASPPSRVPGVHAPPPSTAFQDARQVGRFVDLFITFLMEELEQARVRAEREEAQNCEEGEPAEGRNGDRERTNQEHASNSHSEDDVERKTLTEGRSLLPRNTELPRSPVDGQAGKEAEQSREAKIGTPRDEEEGHSSVSTAKSGDEKRDATRTFDQFERTPETPLRDENMTHRVAMETTDQKEAGREKPLTYRSLLQLFPRVSPDDERSSIIDVSVYSRNRCFRLLHSSKFQKHAFLEVSPANEFPLSSDERVALLRSLVSLVPPAMPLFHHREEARCTYTGDGCRDASPVGPGFTGEACEDPFDSSLYPLPGSPIDPSPFINMKERRHSGVSSTFSNACVSISGIGAERLASSATPLALNSNLRILRRGGESSNGAIEKAKAERRPSYISELIRFAVQVWDGKLEAYRLWMRGEGCRKAADAVGFLSQGENCQAGGFHGSRSSHDSARSSELERPCRSRPVCLYGKCFAGEREFPTQAATSSLGLPRKLRRLSEMRSDGDGKCGWELSGRDVADLLREREALVNREQQTEVASCLFFSATQTAVVTLKGNRFCERIGRPHKSNSVSLVLLPEKGCFYQKCYDPDCQGFRSPPVAFPPHLHGLHEAVEDLASVVVLEDKDESEVSDAFLRNWDSSRIEKDDRFGLADTSSLHEEVEGVGIDSGTRQTHRTVSDQETARAPEGGTAHARQTSETRGFLQDGKHALGCTERKDGDLDLDDILAAVPV